MLWGGVPFEKAMGMWKKKIEFLTKRILGFSIFFFGKTESQFNRPPFKSVALSFDAQRATFVDCANSIIKNPNTKIMLLLMQNIEKNKTV